MEYAIERGMEGRTIKTGPKVSSYLLFTCTVFLPTNFYIRMNTMITTTSTTIMTAQWRTTTTQKRIRRQITTPQRRHFFRAQQVGWWWVVEGRWMQSRSHARDGEFNGTQQHKKGPRDINDVSWATGKLFLLLITFFFLLTNFFYTLESTRGQQWHKRAQTMLDVSFGL